MGRQYTQAGGSVAAQSVRLAEQPPLSEVDADLAERGELFDRGGPFTDDPRADPLCERLQRAQQVLAAGGLADLGAERAGDLEAPGTVLQPPLEPRITPAAIVERGLG